MGGLEDLMRSFPAILSYDPMVSNFNSYGAESDTHVTPPKEFHGIQ